MTNIWAFLHLNNVSGSNNVILPFLKIILFMKVSNPSVAFFKKMF